MCEVAIDSMVLVFTTPPGAFPPKSWEGRKSTEDRKDCLCSFSSHPELALTLRVTSLHQSSTVPPAQHYALIDTSFGSRAPLIDGGGRQSSSCLQSSSRVFLGKVRKGKQAEFAF